MVSDLAPRSTRANPIRNGSVWASLRSPETYLGYEHARGFASAGDAVLVQTHNYVAPDRLNLNHWALAGDWTLERRASVLNRTEGQILFRFHARDVHLVMGPQPGGASVPFRVLIDGEPPGDSHGIDTDDQGSGTLDQQRLYQLIRQPVSIHDRTVEIIFLAPVVEAYVFTFG